MLPIIWCNSVFCNTRKWKVLRSYHQTVAFILCQKKKPQKNRRRPLNVSRGGQFAVSQITCLLPPVTQFPSPPADSANKKRSKEKKKSFKGSHFTSENVYLFHSQAKRNQGNSPPFRSSTFVGKETHYLAAYPVTGQQCGWIVSWLQKQKGPHLSTVILGQQPACVSEGWLRGGQISPRRPWRRWWNRARGGAALPAEIQTKLPLLRLLFAVPKHWPAAPHSFLEVAGLPCSINGLIHSDAVNAPKNVQIN